MSTDRPQQVWAIFVTFKDGNDDEAVARKLIDFTTYPACSSAKELAALKAEIEKEYAAINTPFFITMSMHDPEVDAIMFPRLTSPSGRRQFIQFVHETCIGMFTEADFDRLFAAASKRSAPSSGVK